VAKRLTEYRCRLDGEWGRSTTGALDGSGDRRKGRGSFGGEFGASHWNL